MQYVAYYRVSTQKQGRSGLGLAAQQEIVQRYVTPKDQILASFTEVESGSKANRVELEKAIAYTKTHGARLLIARLDRLSRNVAFIFQLRNSQVDFIALDIPDANTLTIGIMAVLAQHERELISARTKSALSQKKKAGHRLGSPQNLTAAAREKGREIRLFNATNHQANRQASELARMYKSQGLTLQAIADKLNLNGYRTRRGKNFQPTTIFRLICNKAVKPTAIVGA